MAATLKLPELITILYGGSWADVREAYALIRGRFRSQHWYVQGCIGFAAFNLFFVTWYFNFLIMYPEELEPVASVKALSLLGVVCIPLWPVEAIALVTGAFIGFVYFFQFMFDVIQA